MSRRLVIAVLLFGVTFGSTAGAQAPAPTNNDAIFARAKRLVSEGNGIAGRALVDSVLRRAPEGTTAYGDALYWRGALAQTAAEAERDYRRVIVEYPLSLYADDALLAMAELEQGRGDRAGALQHLTRFVHEHPAGQQRGIAAFAAARLAFELRDTKTACTMLADSRTSTPAENVELHNQIDYYAPRCTPSSVPASAAPQPTPVAPSAPATPPKRDTAPPLVPAAKRTTAAPIEKPTVVTRTPAASAPAPEPVRAPATDKPAKGSYTIQLAAYRTRLEAERLITSLGLKGVKARVSGTDKLFRVRLDFYPTRQAALDELAALKARGIIGFVTTEEPAREGARP